MSYKSIVMKRKPGAECARHQDGSWYVYDPVMRIGHGNSPAAAWRDAAAKLVRVAEPQSGEPDATHNPK